MLKRKRLFLKRRKRKNKAEKNENEATMRMRLRMLRWKEKRKEENVVFSVDFSTRIEHLLESDNEKSNIFCVNYFKTNDK